MAQCAVSGKQTVIFQYVRFTEAGKDPRVVFVRFDSLHRVNEVEAMNDFTEPVTMRWNPGPNAQISLDDHRALASDPTLRAIPPMVRATVSRQDMRSKLTQFLRAREQLLNP